MKTRKTVDTKKCAYCPETFTSNEALLDHACDRKPHHTPTPWKLSQTGKFVMHSRPGTVINVCEASPEDSAFIVRACNNYEPMLELLKELYGKLNNKYADYGIKMANVIARAEDK